ncbi:uncharacterized protein Dana_GF15556 [Drosophila ananassae]|uniref:DNA polymerase delta subunit 3 n=1 Tax=Drosophila ananassae TaxID=7217 RepID=B3MM89_DROAN|nr:DNA polymerase delta subunit 3 [Drosophila ananassae]EDV31849.1 uncharacterized protein Dana_GF15556 [Drosophila ananassae]
MSLKKALEDCLIDFDRRIMVTDLLEEYKLPYKEVNETLEEYIKKQEPATKFEKRFLVHGKRSTEGSESGSEDEVFTVVQESKLQDWLSKLKDAQSQLYSVEIAGGSKSPATIFQPMQYLEVKLGKVEPRAGVNGVDKPAPVANGAQKTSSLTNGVKKEDSKATVKQETVKSSVKSEPSKSAVKKESEKVSPESKKTSPKEQASSSKAGAAKKGSISSFFTAAPAGNKQKDVKPTPSKASSTMDNFFKKQPPGAKKSPPAQKESATAKQKEPSPKNKKKSPSPTKKKAAANTSVQLFDEESAESSDEEEKLDKMRRKVIGSEDESDKEKPMTSKRRRISDSEDEEQPPKKAAEAEPVTVDDESMDTEPANETYLDEEGFVITQRKPSKSQPAKKKPSPKAAAPAAKKKSPPSAPKGGKEATKTKQAGILNFFSKK